MTHRPPTAADIGKQVEVSDQGEWLPCILREIHIAADGAFCTLDRFFAQHDISLVRVPYSCPDPIAELSMAADLLAERGADEAARILLNAAELLANNEREMKRLAEKYFENGMIPKSLLTPNPEPQT